MIAGFITTQVLEDENNAGNIKINLCIPVISFASCSHKNIPLNMNEGP
jgi:hypothetical protein